MNPNDSIETTAPTVDQAVNQALAQLGAEQDDVNIEVLSTPRAGVLGLGARQARVRVTRRVAEGASSGVTSPPPAPSVLRGQAPVSTDAVGGEMRSERSLASERSVTEDVASAESEGAEVDHESE